MVPLRGRLNSESFRGAEQRFLLLFLEKEGYQSMSCISGASPRPRGSASRKTQQRVIPRSGTTLFASFSAKRSMSGDELTFWGQPQTPWFRFAEGSTASHSAERNNAFCFFFWKKKYVRR
jgi:hypothetical protein